VLLAALLQRGGAGAEVAGNAEAPPRADFLDALVEKRTHAMSR
jgi:hypothetical protein